MHQSSFSWEVKRLVTEREWSVEPTYSGDRSLEVQKALFLDLGSELGPEPAGDRSFMCDNAATSFLHRFNKGVKVVWVDGLEVNYFDANPEPLLDVVRSILDYSKLGTPS